MIGKYWEGAALHRLIASVTGLRFTLASKGENNEFRAAARRTLGSQSKRSCLSHLGASQDKFVISGGSLGEMLPNFGSALWRQVAGLGQRDNRWVFETRVVTVLHVKVQHLSCLDNLGESIPAEINEY